MKNILLALIVIIWIAIKSIAVPVPQSQDIYAENADQLRAALVNAQPGQTIWLSDKLPYRGHFLAAANGTAPQRITIRSRPGQLAVLDGNYSTFLSASVTANDTILTVMETSDFRPALTLTIDSEDMQVAAVLDATRIQVNRHWNGTTATSHVAGSTIRPTYNPTLKITGAYVTIRNLRVMNSDPNRTALNADGVSFSQRRGSGIWVEGTYAQIYNNYVDDNGDGQDAFDLSVGAEVIGNVFYNNGISGASNDNGGRDHGQGRYTHNKHGDPLKIFRDNISINNYSTGAKAYGVTGYAENFIFQGEISLNNGSHAPLGHLYERANNLFVGTEVQPVDLITIEDCFFYHPDQSYKGGLQIGYAPTVVNGTVVIRRCYILGDQITFISKNISNLTFTDNYILCRHSDQIAQNETMIQPLWLTTMTPTLNFDRNTYFDQTKIFSGQQYPVRYGTGTVAKTFAQWRSETGQDVNSTYSHIPTGMQVFLRVNPIDPNRAHLVVINWDLQATITPDLSSWLVAGDKYLVRNAQDPLGPGVAAGVFGSCPVTLPMDTLRVAAPIGGIPSAPLGREFQVFILERVQ